MPGRRSSRTRRRARRAAPRAGSPRPRRARRVRLSPTCRPGARRRGRGIGDHSFGDSSTRWGAAVSTVAPTMSPAFPTADSPMGEGGTDDATACGRRAPARGSILGALGRRRTDRGVAARAAPRLLRAGGAGGCHRSDRVSLRRWRSGTRAPAAADERDRVDARPPGRPDGLEPLRSRVRGRRAHPGDRARERDLRAAVGARGAGDVEARCDSGPDGRLDRGRPTPRHRAGLRGSLGERGNARPAGSGRRRRHDERHRARRDRRSGGSSSAVRAQPTSRRRRRRPKDRRIRALRRAERLRRGAEAPTSELSAGTTDDEAPAPTLSETVTSSPNVPASSGAAPAPALAQPGGDDLPPAVSPADPPGDVGDARPKRRGNSEHAPGHDPAGPGNSEHAPGHTGHGRGHGNGGGGQ